MLTKTEPLIEMTTGNVNNANIDCAMVLIIICLVDWMDGWKRAKQHVNGPMMEAHRKAHFNFNHILRSARSLVAQSANRFSALMTNREFCLRVAALPANLCHSRHCSHELEKIFRCSFSNLIID